MNRRSVLRWAAGGLAGGSPAAEALARRRVAVRYEVAAPSLPVSLWLPVPGNDANQRIDGLRFSVAGRRVVSGENRYFFVNVAAGQRVTMEFQVTRTERRGEMRRPESQPRHPACCVGPDRLVPIDGRIRAWAEEVVRAAGASTDIEKARAIYEHVIDTVKYDKSGHGWGRGDIYYACDARRGNCSDFHAIFIGYARAVGIPAKFVVGFPFPRERGAGEIAGYHCWAEFFAEGVGWVPVDASEAAKDPARRRYFFGALDENRVELSQGRDLILAPRQAGEPLNFFVYAYGEAAGKAVEVGTRVFFRDLG